MKRAVFALLFLFTAAPAGAADNLQGLLQMIDYVSVDYPEAVADGRVVNAAEYDEMRDFSRAITAGVEALGESEVKAGLKALAASLTRLVETRAPAGELSAVTRELREGVMRHYDVVAVPRRAPDLATAQTLYAEQCAACHGAEGRGDGPQAQGMEPAPIDFGDRSRAAQRSLFGLYNTITLGVDETAMPGFEHLSGDERWSLAFLIGRWGLAPSRVEEGEARWPAPESPVADLALLATLSEEEVGARYGTGAQELFAFLRSRPELLFEERPGPLAFTRERLAAAVSAYRDGRGEEAHRVAVEAYLEGFELAEAGLNVVAPALRGRIEQEMTAIRHAIRTESPAAGIEARAAAIDGLLAQAEAALEERRMSGGEAFAGAAVILLREGLEAILVVAALAAFLVKTGRRDALKYLHAGWVGALLLGAATWWLATYVVAIGGAGRELTEGVAALAAAAVLFYVGFWLHSKTAAVKWKQFIEENVNRALGASTLWSLAALSFIAVYREVFETILFYQALWAQTGIGAERMVLAGGLSSALLLVVLAVIIVRASRRLPLRQFFGATGVLMFVLAVVFAGKGIAALQEAGKLPLSPLESLPAIDLLGLYPNLQSLGLQLAMLLVGGWLFYRQGGLRLRSRPA